ncbi:MAG: hypothetical protein IJZ33_07115 [Clostridia bacterium]|nr:hypothetical protein [Clostridia bacterium]
MYEQLLYPQKHPVRTVIFVIGILLLPFAFFDFSIQQGRFVFEWSFDFIELIGSIALSITYFLPAHQKFHYQNIPYLAVLVLEFIQFGTVSILGNEIPFVPYVASAFLMLSALGAAFVTHFVAEGKMRSRTPMVLWSSAMIVIALVSIILGYPPLGVYTEITEGILVRNLSGCIWFVLFNSTPILLAVALKSDHFPKKQKRKKKKAE